MRTSMTIAGNLTSSPSSRWMTDGTHVTDFGLAHNHRKLDRESGLWVDGGTTFYTVSCWRKLADNVTACLQKGDAVVVMGWFSLHEYERRDGTLRSELRIEGQAVGPDLARVMAPVIRMPRPAQPPSSAVEQSQAPTLTAVPSAPAPDAVPFFGDGPGEPDDEPVPDFADGEEPGLLQVAPGGRD